MDDPNRKGQWIQTFSGICFWPLDPRPEEIRIEDIAHALAMQCRFNGHCRAYYSVAQHSVLVAELVESVEPGSALEALLHDASEAYLSDLPRPLKVEPGMAFYLEAERRLQEVVFARFGLDGATRDRIVEWADDVLLATEARDLMQVPIRRWEELPEPLSRPIEPMAPLEAEAAFLESFARLRPGHAGGAF